MFLVMCMLVALLQLVWASLCQQLLAFVVATSRFPKLLS
jgi:hypothetical protein